jgi:hypothetical protein
LEDLPRSWTEKMLAEPREKMMNAVVERRVHLLHQETDERHESVHHHHLQW